MMTSLPMPVPMPAPDRAPVITAMRSLGIPFREIAARLGISSAAAFYSFHGTPPRRVRPTATDEKTIYMSPHNGGCSTLSGFVPVSLPRIRALEVQA